MNDINTQIQIRSIISAPVLHPTQLHLLPFLPFQMVIGRGCLGGKLITIEDLHNEVTELATNLVNGGSIDHFMLPQGILHQVDNDGKIILLTQKRKNSKTLLERKLQKLQEAPSRSADTIPQQTLQFHSNHDDIIPQQSRSDDTIKINFQKLQEAPSRSADTIPQQPLQFHSNRDDTIPQKSRGDDTIIAGSNIPPLALLDIPSGWILPHRRAHEDKRNVTVQYVFTWVVRLCATLKHAFSIHQIGL